MNLFKRKTVTVPQPQVTVASRASGCNVCGCMIREGSKIAAVGEHRWAHASCVRP